MLAAGCSPSAFGCDVHESAEGSRQRNGFVVLGFGGPLHEEAAHLGYDGDVCGIGRDVC